MPNCFKDILAEKCVYICRMYRLRLFDCINEALKIQYLLGRKYTYILMDIVGIE